MAEPVDPVQTRLRSARVARLATLDSEGRPHVVPVCFAYDGAAFYTAIDFKPKRVAAGRLARLRNIRANPQVALVVDEYQDDWSRLWYILVRGNARLLMEADVEERARALGLLRAKYSQYEAGLLSDDAPILKITPERVTSWGRL
jgi:PPOX class probable F420-dependent enzyme